MTDLTHRPLAIAHRGASAYAPENTAAAFDLAIAMGADAIETDVQLTRDGELVLFHDDTVGRTSDGLGPLADYTLAELQALDLGAWFDPRFSGERIVTLATFIETWLPRIPAAIEIKDPRAAVPTARALARDGIRERVEVTSFSWGALLDAQAVDDRLVLGFLSPQFDRGIIARCVARGFAQICPHVDTLDAEMVAAAHAAGLTVRAWGVSKREQIDCLRASGADGATVNWPNWLADRRGERGET
ncbi:MAG: glycerophosphodiester phosphodiesterase family protein [Thermomicrobiales bacterium]